MKPNFVSSCIVLFATQCVHASRQVPLCQSETQDGRGVGQGPVQESSIKIPPFELHELEPIPLAVNGDPENRVDLVYFGDGYTTSERNKFLHDAQSLTDTLLSPGGAFAPVRDLLNFWAVFIPSVESGIGTHGVPKNTTFGLYRPGEELRAVFYAYPERVTAACEALNTRRRSTARGRDVRSKRYGCDEPILLANDGFYGGLGGTPTVITASPNNGVQVLRHELGHTLIPAGEEYDGGYAYFGVNAATMQPNTSQQTVPWKHWLSDSKARRTGRVRLEDSRVAVQAYPWFNLSNSSFTIDFAGGKADYPTALLRFSISGIPDENHLNVSLDGARVNFTFSDDHRGSLDRTWVQIPLHEGLRSPSGNSGIRRSSNHTLVFRAHTITCPKPKRLDHEEPSTVDPSDVSAAVISLRLLRMVNSTYIIDWEKDDEQLPEFTNRTSIQIPQNNMSGATPPATWYTARIRLGLPHVRAEGHEAMEEQVRIWYGGCL
ncbi:hypothetical protein QFC22_002317 [Naganishia vaughanmartiniae]|uniref:Uncharacterized protein n=1 Tax=Naganishia vaughanmartiniae TaxID=1424756 RepID=A0ACC2XG53_9TREE|nr:hypothetical protein QFC22_002317 [Naganishia vaughanmartiniae]